MAGLTNDDIRTALRNAAGPHIGLFIPESCFEQLVREQVGRLEDPSLQCLDLVYTELLTIISLVEKRIPELQHYHVLRERLVEAATDLVRALRDPARKMITNIIAIHLSYINTSHPDFKIELPPQQQQQQQQQQQRQQQQPQPPQLPQQAKPGDRRTHAPPPAPIPPPPVKQQPAAERFIDDSLKEVPPVIKITTPLTPKEQREATLIELLMKSYFGTVRKHVNDAVPKAIMYFLVNAAKDRMHIDLMNRLYKPDALKDLFEESHATVEKRKALKLLLDVLKQAQHTVNQVRTTSILT
eukprot:TRINITY_DN358_c0_g1_i15.p1 TRINITY_DN358_c0_g1~~TRINITY_DN358_c0_g1_i15.p1  ORF type:complete len:298 (-),score=125.87 TRINITY_DN358_c0_g1_i15:57-950(-)